MKNTYIVICAALVFLSSGCVTQDEFVGCPEDARICPDGSSVGRIPPECDFEPCPSTGMSLERAMEIAEESECAGLLEDEAFYNEDTETWWIELELEKEGCNPACVVSATGAEINWRCTGALP